MLVLSRKTGEQIFVGDDIKIVVNRISGNRVSLGIQAPSNVKIVRGELDSIVKAFDNIVIETDVLGADVGIDPAQDACVSVN